MYKDLNFQKHYWNRYRPKRRKPLTYVIGARCADGAVIVADRRIWRDMDYEEGDKIFKVKNLVVGSSGFRGIIERFNEELSEKLKEGMNFLDTKKMMEDIVNYLNTRYRPRFIAMIPRADEEKFQLVESLVAIKHEGKVKLLHVNSNGYIETIETYRGIGHGEPYGAVFLKKTWEGLWKLAVDGNKQLDMKDVSSLLSFAITMVQGLEIDKSVGDGFNVWIIPDEAEPRELTEKEYEEVVKTVSELLEFVDLGQFDRWQTHSGF